MADELTQADAFVAQGLLKESASYATKATKCLLAHERHHYLMLALAKAREAVKRIEGR